MEAANDILNMSITLGTYNGEPITVALWVCVLAGFFLGSIAGR